MHFTSEQRLDDGVLEREFTLGKIPGILWTPGSASASAPAPLILVGHPGGLHKMYPRLVARAQHSAAEGFASSSHWSIRRSRNGGPPWTPSFRCPRSAARSGTREE